MRKWNKILIVGRLSGEGNRIARRCRGSLLTVVPFLYTTVSNPAPFHQHLRAIWFPSPLYLWLNLFSSPQKLLAILFLFTAELWINREYNILRNKKKLILRNILFSSPLWAWHSSTKIVFSLIRSDPMWLSENNCILMIKYSWETKTVPGKFRIRLAQLDVLSLCKSWKPENCSESPVFLANSAA